MDNYNGFCKNKHCIEYIEWDYEIELGEQPYPCTSCRKVGQSYEITEYPKDCLFLDEIKKIELNNE